MFGTIIALVVSFITASSAVFLQFQKPDRVKKLEPIFLVVFVVVVLMIALVFIGDNQIQIPVSAIKVAAGPWIVPIAIATWRRKDEKQKKLNLRWALNRAHAPNPPSAPPSGQPPMDPQ
jgi:hypothetical protein